MELKYLALACVALMFPPCGFTQENGKCTVINQNFYGFESQEQQQRTAGYAGPDAPVAAGPPGKAGPSGERGGPGLVGRQGVRGQKGEPADNVEQSERFLAMERKVQDMESVMNNCFTPPKSCAYANGFTPDASSPMMINPLPYSPFFVHCNFSGGSGVTIVGHDSENEIKATNCLSAVGPAICYRRNIVYSASDAQIRALIDSSAECKQYVKFRCYQIATLPQWVDRHGVTRTNFGSRTDGKCACGEAGTCENGQTACNCKSNDNVWRQDEGYFTVKDDLPVKALLFGDLDGSDEHIYHTLGKLECSGRA